MKSRPFIVLVLVLLFVLSGIGTLAQEATPEATEQILSRPAIVVSGESGGVTLARLFPSLLQGQVGLLHLTGDNIQEARVLFRNREYPFSNSEEDGWYAFVVADMDTQARSYPLSVIIRLTNGEIVNFADTITVESNGYIRQFFEVPPALAYLIDPSIERNEYARLDTLIDNVTPQRYWSDNVWILPIDTGYNSSFGQYRILNQAVQTRHTGWDQSTPAGTSVAAMNDGVIAFAGELDIRGNYILIDHGWGVYTGYAHLSEMSVQAGDVVARGEVIAASGNTGRSSGPHLHWEFMVNGEFVDGVLFFEMWLP